MYAGPKPKSWKKKWIRNTCSSLPWDNRIGPNTTGRAAGSFMDKRKFWRSERIKKVTSPSREKEGLR